MGTRGEVYSTKVQSEKRTFFFNVKENRLGEYFLSIVESRKNDSGDFDRQQIMVYQEDIDAFMRELGKASAVVMKKKELDGR